MPVTGRGGNLARWEIDKEGDGWVAAASERCYGGVGIRVVQMVRTMDLGYVPWRDFGQFVVLC